MKESGPRHNPLTSSFMFTQYMFTQHTATGQLTWQQNTSTHWVFQWLQTTMAAHRKGWECACYGQLYLSTLVHYDQIGKSIPTPNIMYIIDHCEIK